MNSFLFISVLAAEVGAVVVVAALVWFNCGFKVCASEVGYLVGESPTGRIRRFTTETRCPG